MGAYIATTGVATYAPPARRFEAATLTCKGVRGVDQSCSMGLTGALEATERPDPPGE
jgi:hypothetical protein